MGKRVETPGSKQDVFAVPISETGSTKPKREVTPVEEPGEANADRRTAEGDEGPGPEKIAFAKEEAERKKKLMEDAAERGGIDVEG